MDARRPPGSASGESGSSSAVAAARAAKKKSASKVKVVASRYAQVLQSKNIESQAAARGLPAAPSPAASGGAGGGATKATTSRSVHVAARGRAAPSSSVAQPTPRPKSETHASKTPAGSKEPSRSGATSTPNAAVNPPSTIATTPAVASELVGQDLKERLKAYKANKALPAHQRQPSSSSTKAALATPAVANASASKPRPAALKSHTVRERPAFPKRINSSTGAERSAKRPAKGALEPVPVETTVLAPKASLSTTPRARASSSGSAISAVASSSLSRLSQPPPQTDEEELELLEAMYYQLCFTEMRADQAFWQQEQSAERQILAAWSVFQSKLQLLHDTALRLDREKHIQRMEESLADQALPSVQLASRLPGFVESLRALCSSLEASLHCLPTPGIVCNDPLELKLHVDALATELDSLLRQVQATNLDSKVSSVVAFERGMELSGDNISAALLQVANLAEGLLQEVNTETSIRIQQLQRQRVASAMDRKDIGLW